jgi:hypothetical protein
MWAWSGGQGQPPSERRTGSGPAAPEVDPGGDADRHDLAEGSLLRSILLDTPRPRSNEVSAILEPPPSFSDPIPDPGVSDQDLHLENIILNILDLHDDDLFQLLVKFFLTFWT